MLHVALHDTKAGKLKERRKPAVRSVEQHAAGDERRERVGAHHAERTGKVSQVPRQDQSPDAVRDRGRHRPRYAILPPPADARRHVGVAESANQHGQVARVAL